MATWPTFPIQGSRLVSAFRGDFNSIIDALVTVFVGATSPNPTYSCMLWADTSEGTLKQRNTGNTAWNVVKLLNQDYGGMLPVSGGTMTGPINMNNQNITNLPAGSGDSPARYTDLSAYAKLDGTTPFTGIPSLPASNPISDNQAVRKRYVDDTIYAGGTYTGQITMTVSPTAANHVMRKTDVETIRDTHTHSGAIGYGSKIGYGSIHSNTKPSNKVLTSNGDNGVVWNTPPASIIRFPGQGIWQHVATVSHSASWQGVSLAADLPTDTSEELTEAVSLVVIKSSYAASWTIYFREYLSTATGIPYLGLGSNSQPYHRVLVPVNGRYVEVLAEKLSGDGTLLLYMDYYVRKGAVEEP